MAMTTKQRIAAATALATAIAIPAEGLRQYAYRDTGSIWTVCNGHTGKDIVVGRKYTLAECGAFMTEDMAHAVNVVESCQPGLPAPILASFSDAVFNMGPTIACDTKNSTAARLLKAKAYDAACDQLPRWDKARIAGILVSLPGLTKRRATDRQLCLTWKQS